MNKSLKFTREHGAFDSQQAGLGLELRNYISVKYIERPTSLGRVATFFIVLFLIVLKYQE